MSFSVNSLKITFVTSCLMVAIITILLNLRKIAMMLSGPEKEADERVANAHNLRAKEEVEKFRKSYASLSTLELDEIITDKRYILFAREAAGIILEERSKLDM